MSYSRPQNFSFYGFDPQNVYTTKRHFLARNDAFLALIGPDLTHSAMCGLGKVNQRKKRRQWKTGHSTRPPTSPDRSQSIMACGLQRVVLYIKFFLKIGSVVGGRKSSFPITMVICLYSSLYYRTSRDNFPP